MREFRDMSAAAAASSQTFPAQTSAISDPNSGGREREENVTMLLEDASDNQFRQVGGGDAPAAISGNGLGEKEKKKLNLALESAASDGDGILLESAVSDGGDGILLAVQREQEEEEEEQPVSVDGEIVSGGDNGEAEDSREDTSEAVSDESLGDGRRGSDDLRENCGSSSSSTPESCDLLLPADVGKHVMTLQCQSSAPGGICIVRIVGTAHVSKDSCKEVEDVIRHVKPQVVFLELCTSRVAILVPQKSQVPTFSKMLEMWRKKEMNAFGVIYSWFLAKVGEKLEVLPGSEFRVGYEQALACGAKVTLGDRPVHITLQRTWARMSMWHKAKFFYSILLGSIFMPTADELATMMEKMEKTDEITYMIQTLSKTFPTLLETLVQERDQYMVASLRSVARQSTSVVAVVGRGHLAGIAANWEQDIPVESLLTVPKRKPRQLGLWSAAALAIGGLAFVAGVHHMRNR
ncbi:unnamed protein product [Sphagnum balticum]